jgi:adenylosuccinate synthase
VPRVAKVVIGAGFGDEGKGLVTDALSWKSAAENVTVVRFNGGAQAGHTVVTPEGKRHIFSHFSAGSFAGARTFLSQFFVVNPILFHREKSQLDSLSCRPEVIVDAKAMVTTPFDMMINQMVESERGDGRHGSVGVGFGETVERCLADSYAIRVCDILDFGRGRSQTRDWIRRKLFDICSNWVPARLNALGYPKVFDSNAHLFKSEVIVERWLDDVESFLAQVKISTKGIREIKGELIFEGAQGLLLDQNSGFFPYVTRSSTGLKNALYLADDAGISGMEVTYCTRSYLTRHGAGPLPGESNFSVFRKAIDRTNLPHEFQGKLRFAPLNLDILADAISRDLKFSSGSMNVIRGVAVTCMDQIVDEPAVWSYRGRRILGGIGDLTSAVESGLGLKIVMESWGESRSSITLR